MTVFSLLDRSWILCAMDDGSTEQLSIRAIFDGSRQPREIRGDSPTQDYAVLRVLLAIFWRAHRHEAVVRPGTTFDFHDWADAAWATARAGSPDTAVLEYLDGLGDRLDLLHPSTPFMQVADLTTGKDSVAPISRIIPEAEGDFFTMRAGRGRESISLAEAARWVIHTQAYDYSGIKSGAIGDPRVKGGRGYPIGTGWTGKTGGTVILGATLRETLVLNTVSACLRSGDGDKPVWERDPDGPAERPVAIPQGPADLATWQARRICLRVDGDRVTGVLVTNGDRIPDAGKDIRADPMTPYRFSPNQTKKGQAPVYYARPYDTSRTMWRSLEPLIALGGEQSRGEHPPLRPATLDALSLSGAESVSGAGRIVNLRLVSASYGPNESTNATTIDMRIDLPRDALAPDSALLRRTILDNANATQKAAVALGRFAGNLLVAAGGDYEFRADPTDGALARLEAPFTRWLRAMSLEKVEAGATSWQDQVLELLDDEAHALLRGAGPMALIGREESAEDRSQIRSAGTAYRRFRSELREALPLATAHAPQTPDPHARTQEAHR